MRILKTAQFLIDQIATGRENSGKEFQKCAKVLFRETLRARARVTSLMCGNKIAWQLYERLGVIFVTEGAKTGLPLV